MPPFLEADDLGRGELLQSLPKPQRLAMLIQAMTGPGSANLQGEIKKTLTLGQHTVHST